MLKITHLIRQFFWAPKINVKSDGLENNLTLQSKILFIYMLNMVQ